MRRRRIIDVVVVTGCGTSCAALRWKYIGALPSWKFILFKQGTAADLWENRFLDHLRRLHVLLLWSMYTWLGLLPLEIGLRVLLTAAAAAINSKEMIVL